MGGGKRGGGEGTKGAEEGRRRDEETEGVTSEICEEKREEDGKKGEEGG